MEDPESRTWVRENTLPFINMYEEDRCCVENCKSKKSIRNFTSLKGVWKVKNNCKHRKICFHHYNHDLKLNPRRSSRKRKRVLPPKPVKVIEFEPPVKKRKRKLNIEVDTTYFPDPDFFAKTDLCCIIGCQRDVSVRKFSSLRGKWVLKDGCENKRKNKICHWHYMEDRRAREIKNRLSETNGLTLLLCASLFV